MVVYDAYLPPRCTFTRLKEHRSTQENTFTKFWQSERDWLGNSDVLLYRLLSWNKGNISVIITTNIFLFRVHSPSIRWYSIS